MATRYAVANGNWSAGATWNGGTLPLITDICYANGYTCTINGDYSVLKITTEVCPDTGIGGGGFSMTASRTLGAIIVSGTTNCLTITNAGTHNIVGYAYGSITNNTCAIYHNGQSTMNFTGNGYAGSFANAYAIRFVVTYGTANYNITGNMYASAYCPALQIESLCNGNVVVTGIIEGSTAFPAIQNFLSFSLYGTAINHGTKAAATQIAAGSTATVSGILYYSSGVCAITSTYLLIALNSTLQIVMNDSGAANHSLYTSDYFVGTPNESDVRNFTVYGVGNSKIGTLIVPSPASVALNVPTDNTVGTMVASGATAAEVWDYLTTSPIVPNSILELILTNLDAKVSDIPADTITELDGSTEDVAVRLQNCATVETTGDQLAALP